MRTAIYPGTFDPITLGHADVIQKSLKVCDRLIVATTNTKNNTTMQLSAPWRIERRSSRRIKLKTIREKNFRENYYKRNNSLLVWELEIQVAIKLFQKDQRQ